MGAMSEGVDALEYDQNVAAQKDFGWTSIMSEIHGYRSCSLLFITTFLTIPAVETNSCRHISSTELRSLFSCCELDSETLIW